MRIETNTINVTGMIFCLFWYVIYAVAVLFLSASRFWLAARHSSESSGKSDLKFNNTTKNPLNYRTT